MAPADRSEPLADSPHGKTLRLEIPFVRVHRRGRQPIRLRGLFEDGTPEYIANKIAALTGLPNLGFRRLDFAPGNVEETQASEHDQDSEG